MTAVWWVVGVTGYFVVGFVVTVIAFRKTKVVCEDDLGHLVLLAWPLAGLIWLVILLLTAAEKMGGCDRDG
jgi:hypothetical protein